MESSKKTYIGVKMVEAYPEERDGQPGYAVIYPDGYKSWSPADVFEAAYFQVKYPDRVSQEDVCRMLGEGKITSHAMGTQTIAVHVTLSSGFEMLSAARGSKEHFTDEYCVHLCMEECAANMWNMLSFVMHWARNGLKK